MRLNKLCNVEDWCDPVFLATVRRIEPHYTQATPQYPTGHEHRKHWEYAHVLNGLDKLGVIRPESIVLSVAGGHEVPAFELTNRVRWVFLTDLYGQTGFSGNEAPTTVLTNPDSLAPLPYNRNRLVVQHMDALDLRFEADTFDAVFCLSSIEHFGGVLGARKALREIHRVVRPGGVVALTTECMVDASPDYEEPGLILFSQASVEELAHSAPGLELVEPIDFSLSEETRKTSMSFLEALEDARLQRGHWPHIVLELAGRSFTSLALFLRKQQ
ncbi:MAG: class I SAM-dependent methyltransferase [Bryobacteraceae bacterium]|jgi:SAM-dependent methyltransferase